MPVVLVCGSRAWAGGEAAAFSELERLTAYMSRPLKAIQGGARGPDEWARKWADDRGHEVLTFEAHWDADGRAAGPRRNQRMLVDGKPDVGIAFWDGTSRGTLDMIRRLTNAGVPVRIVPVPKP